MGLFASCSEEALPAALLLLLLFSSRALSQCPTPVLPPHSSLRGGGDLEDTYPAGTNLPLRCISGYEYIYGSVPRITCLATGKWTDLPTLCQGQRCPVPNIDNGNIVSTNDLRLGEQVTLGCDDGFRIIGGDTRLCVLKGGKVDWDRELPICQRIPCVRPPVIANGRYDANPSDVYDAGSVVIYRCDADYSLIGHSSIACVVAKNGVDGEWNKPSPECKKVKCHRPNIPNGRVDSVFQATYTYQNKLLIACNPGYSFTYSPVIECDADSQWKPPGPWCDKTTVAPPTTTQTTPKEGSGSGHAIGIAIGAVIAVLVLAALIFAAVKYFGRRGKANTHPASTDNYHVVSKKDVALEEKSKD